MQLLYPNLPTFLQGFVIFKLLSPQTFRSTQYWSWHQLLLRLIGGKLHQCDVFTSVVIDAYLILWTVWHRYTITVFDLKVRLFVSIAIVKTICENVWFITCQRRSFFLLVKLTKELEKVSFFNQYGALKLHALLYFCIM